MEHGRIDLEDQIERCRRLASLLTDDQMRHALKELAERYEAQLALRRRNGENFMLRG
jgi:hypothetical protein